MLGGSVILLEGSGGPGRSPPPDLAMAMLSFHHLRIPLPSLPHAPSLIASLPTCHCISPQGSLHNSYIQRGRLDRKYNAQHQILGFQKAKVVASDAATTQSGADEAVECEDAEALALYIKDYSSHTSTQGASKAELFKASEPKWKQKLATTDKHAERTRQLTLQAQKEYENEQTLLLKQQGTVVGDAVPLNGLEFFSYLTEEGVIINCSKVDAKATVYAIFDECKILQYVGITRQVYHSMRLNFARVPTKCFYAKVHHVSSPSRLLLEHIRNAWLAENGVIPMGNDNGPHQHIWENALDCKPLMTEEEKQKFDEVCGGPLEATMLKDVARRIEKEIIANCAERNCKEKLRFDPKVKERGFLDLKNVKAQVDASVPTTNLKSASKTKS